MAREEHDLDDRFDFRRTHERLIDDLRARNALLVKALEAVIEGRPTEPPPEIMRGTTSWRNWELWQKCRKALAANAEREER